MSALADYLLRFDDQSAFANWGTPTGAQINPVRAVTVVGVNDVETGTELVAEECASGFWVQVFCTEKTDTVRDMQECMARGYRSNGWRLWTGPDGIVALEGSWIGSEIDPG